MLTEKQKLWKGYVIPDFAELMIKQLAQHSERGDSWKEEDPDWLLGRAKEELEEVEGALKKLNTSLNNEHYKKRLKYVAKECADVSNFMMMIVDSIDDCHRI